MLVQNLVMIQMQNVRLTNGTETFSLGSILEDEIGPVHGVDSRGSGYTRCSLMGLCDHIINPDDETPSTYKIWHDDEHTETLWEVN